MPRGSFRRISFLFYHQNYCAIIHNKIIFVKFLFSFLNHRLKKVITNLSWGLLTSKLTTVFFLISALLFLKFTTYWPFCVFRVLLQLLLNYIALHRYILILAFCYTNWKYIYLFSKCAQLAANILHSTLATCNSKYF